MTPVNLKIRWTELFGTTRKEMSDKTRRERWEEWKRLGQTSGRSENVELWSNPEEICFNCEHRDADWCRLQSLPCTVNPIMTFDMNEIGLACMGIGYRNKQLKLELNENKTAEAAAERIGKTHLSGTVGNT